MEARRAITATLVPLFVSAVVALSLVSRKHILPAASAQAKHSATHTDWPVYGGQSADDRYSALHQIHRSNVHKLKVAWTFDTKEPGGLQTNPLIVGRVLFGFTPTQKVIALDAATGKNLWTFSTGTPGLQPTRGLSYWTDGTQSILFAGLLTNLYAIEIGMSMTKYENKPVSMSYPDDEDPVSNYIIVIFVMSRNVSFSWNFPPSNFMILYEAN